MSWPYILQQIFMSSALIWAVWVLWREVRRLLEEAEK